MNDDLSHSLAITAQEPVRWIAVGKLLDATNKRVLNDAHLVYDANKILHVGSQPPTPTLVLGKDRPDALLPDFTALPALIEGHSHAFLEGGELDPEKRTAFQNQAPDTLFLLAGERMHKLAQLGIAAMRDGGDKDSVGLRLSRQRESEPGTAFIPAVFSPGPGIHRAGRYGSFFGKALEDDPDITTCVNKRIAAGADHIKIVPTGIINFAKGRVVAEPQFTGTEILHITELAHAHGRKVMAHASGEAGIGAALEGHVDSIEHGFFVTDDQLRLMRDQNTTWVPTFAPVQVQVEQADRMGWVGETLGNLQRILENHAASLQKAIQLGVTIGVGSDAGSYGVPHGLGLLQEMALLELAGMPTLDLLCRVTYGNRALLKGSPLIGALEIGFKPRFILSAHSALIRVADLANARWVVFDGHVANSQTTSHDRL